VMMRTEELAMLVNGLDLKQRQLRKWYGVPHKKFWNIFVCSRNISRNIELPHRERSRAQL